MGRDGKTSATAKYDKIKNTVHPWRLARRGAQEEGEIVVPEGPVSGGPSGPSPQGVSHVRGNTLSRKTNIGADK